MIMVPVGAKTNASMSAISYAEVGLAITVATANSS